MANKKNDFEFEYVYNKKGSQKTKLVDIEFTYRKGSADTVYITGKSIIIKGSRTKKSSFDNVLGSTQNAIYKELLRGIVFVYMTQGKAFLPGDCTLRVDGDQTGTKVEMTNLSWLKDLPVESKLSKDVCRSIFDNSEGCRVWSEGLLNSLIEYMQAVNSESPDKEILLFEYWKSLNTLYSTYVKIKKRTNGGTDATGIDCMRDLIKKNRSASLRSLALVADENNVNSIMKFNYRSYLINYKNRHEKEGIGAVKNEIVHCDDQRILGRFYAVIEKDNENYEEENDNRVLPFTKEQINKINNHIRVNKHNVDADLLCFAALKYGYYLRCKHVHGESSTPNFLVNDNKETREIISVTNLLKSLIPDLYCLAYEAVKQP